MGTTLFYVPINQSIRDRAEMEIAEKYCEIHAVPHTQAQ